MKEEYKKTRGYYKNIIFLNAKNVKVGHNILLSR